MNEKKPKPKVIVKCVASRYEGPSDRIIEYSFGSDGTGRALGGLIQFYWQNNQPHVILYNHEPEIQIIKGKSNTGA